MYSILVIIGSLFAMSRVFINGIKGLEKGVMWMIVLFFLGYRSFVVWEETFYKYNLTHAFRVHPIDILLVLLFFKAIKVSYKPSIPIWLIFIIPLSLIALVIGLKGDFPLDVDVLFDFKNFILIVPVFLVTGVYLKDDKNLLNAAYYFVLVITALSFFGVVEFQLPSVRAALGGFYENYVYMDYELKDGFDRAWFSHWGAVTVGHIIVCAFPLTYFVRNKIGLMRKPMFFYFVVIINLWALYIAGNRADWLITFLIFFLYFFWFRKIHLGVNKMVVGIVSTALVIIVVLNFISNEAIQRFISGLVALEGDADYVSDSSGFKRHARLLDAWAIIFKKPFGVGWAGSGWVHSDFVQIASNGGWILGLIYAGAFLYTFLHGYKISRSKNLEKNEKDGMVILLICNISVGVMYAINNNYILTQSGVPLLFLWALLHYYTVLIKKRIMERYQTYQKSLYEQAEINGITAHV